MIRWKQVSAMTLIEVLVAIPISAALLYGLLVAGQRTVELISGVQKRLELEDMRHVIRMQLDCSSTLLHVPPGCNNTSMITLYGKNDRQLPLTSQLRIACGDTPRDFQVSYKDQATWKPLFSFPITC